MEHIKHLTIWVVSWLSFFIIAGYGGYFLLKPLIEMSKFRLSVAGNAKKVNPDVENVYLFIGNSRIMGGVNSNYYKNFNKNTRYYNLAYNGLTFADIVALINAFRNSCECNIDTVIINAGVLPKLEKTHRKNEGISDVQIFLSAFNHELQDTIGKLDPAVGTKLSLFPLLHFNNELFLRSLYYLATNKDDQDYSNNYNISLTNRMIKRLQKERISTDIDKKRLSLFTNDLKHRGTKLIVVVPPFHSAYVENVQGFGKYMEDVRRVTEELHIDFQDHAQLFMDKKIFFSDPKHLNTSGQKEYSDYLLETLLKTKDN